MNRNDVQVNHDTTSTTIKLKTSSHVKLPMPRYEEHFLPDNKSKVLEVKGAPEDKTYYPSVECHYTSDGLKRWFQNHEADIENKIEPKMLMPHMCDIFMISEQEQIEYVPVRTERATKFYRILAGKWSRENYAKFLSALVKEGYRELYVMLENSRLEEMEGIKGADVGKTCFSAVIKVPIADSCVERRIHQPRQEGQQW